MAHDDAERPTGTRVVIRLATRAVVALLFLTAALLGTVGGVLFAYGDDLPEISALDNYRPNTITRILASNGDVIGEFATERRVVIGYDDMAPVLRQAIMATEDADFEQHFGLSVSRILDDGGQGRAHRPARRRQHHHAAARPQSVPAGHLHAGAARTSGRSSARFAKPFSPCSSSGVHEARDLRALREPGAAARRLRRRGGRADVLQQVGEGRHARRSRDDCRHHPDARTPQPVRQPRAHAGAAQQLRPAADGRGRLRHAAGRRGRGRRSRSCSAPSPRPSARSPPTSSRTSARTSSSGSAPRRSTRPASRCRRRSTWSCSARPSAPSTAACGGSTSAASGYRKPRQTVAPPTRRPTRYTSPRWRQPIARRRHRAGGGDVVAEGRRPAARDPHRRHRSSICRARRSPGPARPTPRTSSRSATSSRSRSARVDKGQYTAADARAAAARRGRAGRRRQPHRPDSRDGRRLRLRAQQVQPRHAGAAPGRLALQAGRSTPPPSTTASPRSRCSSTSRCRTSRARTSRPIVR